MADATIAANIAEGITQIITDTGASVTYGGNAYTAGRGVMDTDNEYDPLGELEGYSDTYTILQSALDANADDPTDGESLTTPDGVRRILRVRRSTYGVVRRIDVGDLY
jgi:hypothetical protein